jgi:hypothetical protein
MLTRALERLYSLFQPFGPSSTLDLASYPLYINPGQSTEAVSGLVCPLPLGMGGILGIPPTFALRFLSLLGLRPIPTTYIDATIPAAILCAPTLYDAVGAVGALPAARIKT